MVDTFTATPASFAPAPMGAVLAPERDLRGTGVGPEFNLEQYSGRDLVLTLTITRAVEYGSLAISIWGSRDGSDWGSAPLVTFPRKYYCGDYRIRLKLSDHPDIRFLRARWNGERWGVAGSRALFTAQIQIAPAILQ